MICRLFFALCALAIAATAAESSRAEEPAAPPALNAAAEEPSTADANPASSEEAPQPGQADSAAEAVSQEPGAALADEPGAEPAREATGSADAAAPSPAEQAAEARAEAPASQESAGVTPDTQQAAEPSAAARAEERPVAETDETEPSLAASSAEAPSMALQSAEPPAASKAAEDRAPKTLDVPAAAPAEAAALQKALSSVPAGASDEERNERAGLLSFYEARGFAPLWTTSQGGFTAKATAAAGEIKRAKDFGLDPRDFALPAGLSAESVPLRGPEQTAAAEIEISRAVLKYGRYARGGRIIVPSEQLSTYLDRRPQLLKPQAILDGVAAADEPDAYLRGLHPKHPQFERLRQKYLALGGRGKQQNAEAKRLLANMEEWRWMPEDLGDLYVWNNIPDFTQRVVKDGALVRKEAIVTGQTGKQTPVFSRQLRKITFKPTWIVPDSIKVRELLPNLIRGGSLMTQWGLEVLRDGEPVNWRKINWAATDIRNYEVIQPNGPKSVMGKVKFSFPSQHTVFMHDAAAGEKWMFRAPKRTYSHGCMRVQNPVGLAEILLREDKGWDGAKVRETLDTGGNNNEIPIERKIMVHMTYFTALVDDDGKLRTFPDVYGHERRITLALEGKWNQIEKGRDHLAPVELDEAHVSSRRYVDQEAYEPPMPRRGSPQGVYAYRNSFLDSLFGTGYGNGYAPYGQYPGPPRVYQYR